jgi:hypothetical protein
VRGVRASASLSDFERRHLPATLGMLIEVALISESTPLRDFASARLTAYRDDAVYQAAVLASNIRPVDFTEADLMQLTVDVTYAAQASHVVGSLLRRVGGEAPRQDPA